MWSKYPEVYEELKLVENQIRKNIRSRNRLLSEIAFSLVESGGKRLRPAMVIIASRFGKYDREKVIPAAGAFEILHTATLVHDDIIDHSKLRRGKVTVSEKYGSDMAVYTGDYLFTRAMLMFSRGISAEKLDTAAKAIKVICEGEVDQYEERGKLDTTVLSYLKRIRRKTAVLFSAACVMGADLGECPHEVVRALAKYGLCYGMAFQIRDDINDFLSDAKTSGKPVGDDIKKGIITLPVIYSLTRSRKLKNILNGLSGSRKELPPQEVAEIAELVKEYGGIDYSRKMLERYIDKGMDALGSLPDSNCRKVLEDIMINLRVK